MGKRQRVRKEIARKQEDKVSDIKNDILSEELKEALGDSINPLIIDERPHKKRRLMSTTPPISKKNKRLEEIKVVTKIKYRREKKGRQKEIL